MSDDDKIPPEAWYGIDLAIDHGESRLQRAVLEAALDLSVAEARGKGLKALEFHLPARKSKKKGAR